MGDLITNILVFVGIVLAVAVLIPSLVLFVEAIFSFGKIDHYYHLVLMVSFMLIFIFIVLSLPLLLLLVLLSLLF